MVPVGPPTTDADVSPRVASVVPPAGALLGPALLTTPPSAAGAAAGADVLTPGPLVVVLVPLAVEPLPLATLHASSDGPFAFSLHLKPPLALAQQAVEELPSGQVTRLRAEVSPAHPYCFWFWQLQKDMSEGRVAA